MSISVKNAFLFYDLILFMAVGVGIYFNKGNPILGFANGAVIGAVICIILYNLNKDKLTY